MSLSSETSKRREFSAWWTRWLPTTTPSWMMIGLVVATLLTVAVLSLFGLGERGTAIALQLTARWSFILFWLAYAGSAMAKLFGRRFDGLARRSRDFGLAYASAQIVHVGLVIWIIHLATGQGGGMHFFWVGILCTYYLALFSVPEFREALGPRLWRVFRTIALEYIALVFATDFILLRLQPPEFGKYSLTYMPFVLMLVGGVALRVASFARGLAYDRADEYRVRAPNGSEGSSPRQAISKLIAAMGVGVVLFAAIGIGLRDLVSGLTAVAALIAAGFIAAGTFNTWGALTSK